MAAPRLRIFEIGIATRPVEPRDPAEPTLPASWQWLEVFGFANVQVEGRGISTGRSALVVPRVPPCHVERGRVTSDDLIRSLTQACEAHLGTLRWNTAYGHHVEARSILRFAAPAAVDDPRGVDIGCGLIDIAILDALLSAYGLSAVAGVSGNVAGIDTRLMPNLPQTALDSYLASRRLGATVSVRQTTDLDARGIRMVSETDRGREERQSDAVHKRGWVGPYDRILQAACRKSASPEQNWPSDSTIESLAIGLPGLAFHQELVLHSLLGPPEIRLSVAETSRQIGARLGEAASLASAFPDLYEISGDSLMPRVRAGRLDISSLDCAGFASRSVPFPEALEWIAG